jgi:hypothetical protein
VRRARGGALVWRSDVARMLSDAGERHQRRSAVLVSTCLDLELSKSDALTSTYFGDPGLLRRGPRG